MVDAQTNQTSADNLPYVYIALVLDTQTNGAQLSSEDVYTNPGASVNTACNPLRNMSYTERFKVLKKKKIRIPPLSITYDGTNIEQSGIVVPLSMYCKLGALKTTFQVGQTSGYCSTIVDNSLHIVAYSNISSATIPVTLSYNARLRFVG